MTERADILSALEAILFVATDPIPRSKLFETFSKRDRRKAEEALEELIERYAEETDRGILVEEVAGGLRLITRADLAPYLRNFFEISGRNRLSMAALETLAIVAYRQPITAPEVHELRSVNSKGVLTTLLEHRLVRIAGRKQVVGKPFLYKTTTEFLAQFGLNSLEDLPPLDEFEELLGLELGEGAEAAVSGGLGRPVTSMEDEPASIEAEAPADVEAGESPSGAESE